MKGINSFIYSASSVFPPGQCPPASDIVSYTSIVLASVKLLLHLHTAHLSALLRLAAHLGALLRLAAHLGALLRLAVVLLAAVLVSALGGGHVLGEVGQQLVQAAEVGQPSVLVLAAAAAALAPPVPGAGPRAGRAPGLGSSLAADSVRQPGVRGEGLGAGPLGVGALRGVEVGVAAGVARTVRARGRGAAAGLGAVSEACAEILFKQSDKLYLG